MNNKVIRNIIILAFISLTGIIFTQIFWVKQMLDLKENEFENNSLMALRGIALDIIKETNDDKVYFRIESPQINTKTIEFSEPIKIIDFLNVVLANYKQQKISSVIEYNIYSKNKQIEHRTLQLNKKYNSLKKVDYYFVDKIEIIYLKKISFYYDEDLRLLLFFSVVLIIVLGFFAYTINVILRQKQLSEIKTDFVNNMTHEFKTPIATIELSSNVLMKDDIINNPTRLKNYATIIRDENKRLKKQVEAVLQVSQLESKQIQLDLTNINLHEIITTVSKNFKPRLTELEGTLQLQLNATNCVIQGDEMHIKNIIFNLLDNAIKYCDKKPSIMINTQNIDHQIKISVADNGKGIPKEIQGMIFEKFYRVSSGNIHDVKGFGIGLFYVKNMVKRHNGKIEVSSNINEGSTFSLWFNTIKSYDNR
ncbi:MAG: HAMP domain-containing histidine kinase [Chitinophagales bacterium]|nr:HAMP domain-containing histidine kinase [Chitinophagales bacterium]